MRLIITTLFLFLTTLSAQELKRITVTDSLFTIAIPADWNTGLSLNQSAKFQSGSKMQDVFTMVFVESKQSTQGINLTQYISIISSNLQEKLKEGEVSEIFYDKINTFKSAQAKVEGSLNSLNFVYWVTIVEDSVGFYQILTWTLAENELVYGGLADKIAKSFIPHAQLKNVAKKNPIEYRSKRLSRDGLTSLEVPTTWKPLELGNPLISLALTSQNNELNLLLLPEQVADSSSLELEPYFWSVLGNFVKNVKDTTLKEAAYVHEYENMEAIYGELEGTAENGLHITYMIMAIKKENRFYQLVVWATRQKIEQYKESIFEILYSFKEKKQRNKSMIWQIGGANSKVFLLGDNSFLSSTDFPLPAIYDSVLNAANTIYFEADFEALNNEENSEMVKRLSKLENSNLKEFIGAELYTKLKKLSEKLGLNIEGFSHLHPLVTLHILQKSDMQKKGYNDNNDLRPYFLKRAKAKQKTIKYIAEIDRFSTRFFKLKKRMILSIVEEFINNFERNSTRMPYYIQAWKEGDLEKIDLYSNDAFSTDTEVLTFLNDAFHKLYVQTILESIKNNEQALFIFNDGSLAGDYGVIKYLIDRKIPLKQY